MLRARWTTHDGIWRVAVALIAASLLVIPVRCDASPFPHSIFVDPPGQEHAEHIAGNGHVGHVPAVPSKENSPSSEHRPGMAMSADDGSTLAVDPGSVQTGAGMIDAPYSISLASHLSLLLGEGQRLHRSLPITGEPHGPSMTPPSPPPKIEG